jgi:phytanoyl-CoA hydroxylase
VNILNAEQRAAYDEDGFVVLRGLLDPTRDLDPVLVEYAGVLDELAQKLFAADKITSLYEELPFGRRLSQIYLETRTVFAGHFDCTLSMVGVAADSPIWVGPAVFDLLCNGRLLDVLEDLFGGEIYSNPVQHVRIKPPEKYLPMVHVDEKSGRVAGFGVGATPWHQDNGVVLPIADETEMITVWVAVTDATVENGCLEVLRGSHREGLLPHCPSGWSRALYPRPRARPRPRHYLPHAARRRALYAPAHLSFVAAQSQRGRTHQLRPALQPNRTGDGARNFSRLRRP